MFVNFLRNKKYLKSRKQQTKQTEFSEISAGQPLYSIQMDVCVYNRYKIDNYQYILGVIDVYSRYVVCRALTNLRIPTLIEACDSIFEEFSKVLGFKHVVYPKNINTDNEFNNNQFKEYLTEHYIQAYFSQPEQLHKQALIERFWRTLSILIQRWRQGSGESRWYKVLNDLVDNYNNSVHSTTGATPKDMLEGKALDKRINRQMKKIESPFAIGDRVRIKTKKGKLEKGDILTYSKEIYIITDKTGNKNRIMNMTTNVELRRLYTDDELERTFALPKQRLIQKSPHKDKVKT